MPRPGALRVAAVGNALTALAALFLALRAGSGSALGPARTDDLPYGDLLQLDRTGAVVFLLVAVVGTVAALMANRSVLAASAGLWAAVAVVVGYAAVAQASLWGASRPGDLALALGLAAAALVARLDADPAGR